MELNKCITELEKLFDRLNVVEFEGQLQRPIITIQTSGRRKNVLGWCTTYRAWEEPNKVDFTIDENKPEPLNQNYEITICAEHLDRPFEEIAGTMLHEMVHLYNIYNDIKDCSGGKHNKKFRDEAEDRGLVVEKDPRVGYGITELDSVLKEMVNEFDIDKSVFTWRRVPLIKENIKKPERHVYICPTCGAKFNSSKEIKAICADCESEFEEVI